MLGNIRSTRRRWGVKAHRMLKAVQSGLSTTDKILDECLGNYGRVRTRARKNEAKNHSSPPVERERFYKMLSYLKQEGLLEKRKDKKEWELTKKGLKKLNNLEEGRKFTLDSGAYVPVEDTTFRIVIFDIPEKEREKRKWIRAGLVALGFEM
ncbi:MAG: hypothetical protein Q8R20_02470, partial [Nanoarchaeota archaeon]|nr:hypothetical protein [Nanoarchaeota archaeon]